MSINENKTVDQVLRQFRKTQTRTPQTAIQNFIQVDQQHNLSLQDKDHFYNGDWQLWQQTQATMEQMSSVRKNVQ